MSTFVYQSLYKKLDVLAPLLALTLLIIYACHSTQLLSTFGSKYVHDLPKGQALYIMSKTTGLVALGVAALQIIVGYTPSRVSKRLHVILGVSLVVLALCHWLFFSLAVYFRTDIFPWKNLKLWSDGTFYHTGIMLGSLAFWMLIVISMSGFAAKKRILIAKFFHRLGFMVFAMALVHALMIGTESQMFWGKLLFISFSLLIAIVMLYRWASRLLEKPLLMLSKRI